MVSRFGFPVWCIPLVTALLFLALFGETTYSAEQITITYADWQLAQDIWGRSLREAIAEFERLNPGIRVETQPVALAQRDVQFTTAIRAGRGPDVFALDANPVREYIHRGWVKDLTPFVEQAGGEEWLSDFYPRTLLPVTVDGRIYGIPKNTVAMVIVYNSELFRAAGLDKPAATWEEFREQAKQLTRATRPGGPIDQWGMAFVMAAAGFDLRFSSIFRSFGADVLTPDWTASALDTPEAKQAFNFILDLINVDKVIPPGVTSVDANGTRRLLASKQVAMKIGTMWSIAEVGGMNPELHGLLQMSPMPVLAGTSPRITSTLYQKSLFMNPHTKHPEAAWKLIQFLTDPPQMEKWFDDNNMLSARRSVNEGYAPIVNSEYAHAVLAQMEKADFLPLIPEWPEILETFRQSLVAAATGAMGRDEALADAHRKINNILARAR